MERCTAVVNSPEYVNTSNLSSAKSTREDRTYSVTPWLTLCQPRWQLTLVGLSLRITLNPIRLTQLTYIGRILSDSSARPPHFSSRYSYCFSRFLFSFPVFPRDRQYFSFAHCQAHLCNIFTVPYCVYTILFHSIIILYHNILYRYSAKQWWMWRKKKKMSPGEWERQNVGVTPGPDRHIVVKEVSSSPSPILFFCSCSSRPGNALANSLILLRCSDRCA